MGQIKSIILIFLVSILVACNVGKDSILFATKTSIAIDVDTNPPVFDVGYARYEGSIAPVVQSGEVLPLLSSLSANAGISSTVFGSGVAQNFSLGNAAIIMSSYIGSVENPAAGSRPTFDTLLATPASIAGSTATARRYFFGTRTNLGLSVGFAPERSYAPDSISVGYKRKELAYVPIMQNPATGKSRLSIPSLIATAGISTSAQSSAAGFTVSQFYATGSAATYLSALPAIRNAVFTNIARNDELEGQLLAQLQRAEVASISIQDTTRTRAWETLDTALTRADLNSAAVNMASVGLATAADFNVSNADRDKDGTVDDDELKYRLKSLAQPFSDDDVRALNMWIDQPGF